MKKKRSLIKNLIEISEDYMRQNLGFKESLLDVLIRDFRKKTYITEFAHTPSFFHVGI